jgi:negative regulator of flagellin synthesis FlgM
MSGTNGIGILGAAAPQVTPTSPPVATGKEEQVRTSAVEVAAAAKSGEKVDQTSLSSTSELLAAALNGSDVRLEKVSSLQQAIAAGTYKVPAADVAEKLIGSLIS